MGLDIYLQWDDMTETEEVGYLRSSYNEGGFNSWARKHIDGKDFYYIFQPPEAMDYEKGFAPDWDECERRRLEALEAAKKAADDPVVIRCSLFSMDKDKRPDAAEALRMFKEQAEKYKPDSIMGGWFSNRDGDFFLGEEQPEVLAVIPGQHHFPCVFLICKSKDKHKYYIDVLETQVKNFIELGRQKKGRIRWSS